VERNAVRTRDAAMRVVDRHIRDGRLAERGAELVESAMHSGTPFEQSWTRRWTIATGSEAYERAFAKMLTGPHGHLAWTREESDAWRAVAAVQAEQRAMGLTDAAGGFMVPFHLDPAITLTSDGSVNPLREISRVVQTASNAWNGVTSAGVTAEWTAEAAEVADASPTLDQPNIPVHKGDAFVPFSYEIGQDAVAFLSELTTLLRDAADQLTATAFTTGSGNGQPKGVLTALWETPGPVVHSDGAELAADDIFAVQNALPPRFQPRAVWNANLTTLNIARQFETSNGALKFPELQSNPPMLLGRRVYENSNMDAAEGDVLLYGDFAAGFTIVDRIGSTLELVQNLFGEHGRPTGQRGALLWFRTGSDVVVPNAFRVLNVPGGS